MKLIKNDDENLNNKTKKIKVIIIISVVIILAAIIAIVYVVNNMSSSVSGTDKKASTECMMPYSYSNCRTARNETVKQIQIMLNKIKCSGSSVCYSKYLGFDGNFGPNTSSSVKKFQGLEKTSKDGIVGPDTLERMAKRTNTKYFKIQYNVGTNYSKLNSQYGGIQVVLYGINTKISSTKLSNSGGEHVGYTATATINGVKYRYGYYGNNSKNPQATKETDIKNNAAEFHDYIYQLGTTINETQWKTGQVVVFTPKYCNKNETFDKTKNQCISSGTSSSSTQPRQEYVEEYVGEYTKVVVGNSSTITNDSNLKCYQYYSTGRCSSIVDETVKMMQTILKTNGYFSSTVTGKYNQATSTAVKNFQRAKGMTADGYSGPDTVAAIAKAGGLLYYKIEYPNSSVKGQLSKYQTVINNVSIPISTSSINQTGKVHVGYTLKTTVNGITYEAGCKTQSCTTAKWYKSTEKGSSFYPYVYSLGQDAKGNGWSSGQIIKLTAKYCNKNETFDKTKSTCVSPSSTSGNSESGTTSNNNFKMLSYDINGISNKLGPQIQGECASASAAYGVYIISGGGVIASMNGAWSWSNYNVNGYSYGCSKVGSVASVNDRITKEIDNGRPAVIHVTNSTGQHWVIVVGYQTGVAPSNMGLSNLYVIDPFYSKSYPRSGVILKEGVASNFPSTIASYNTDYSVCYWR